jgi:hypothetical protein
MKAMDRTGAVTVQRRGDREMKAREPQTQANPTPDSIPQNRKLPRKK